MNNKLKLIDFEKAKNEIIREIATSKDFHNVVKHICYKNGFVNHIDIIEDVKQEVIEKLLKKDAELIYEWYCDNPKRPFAVALGIAKKQFLKHPTMIGYNKHSFGEYINFASNLKNKNDSEFTLDIKESMVFVPKFVESGNAEELSENDENNTHVLSYFLSFLSVEDREFIYFIMDKDITKGKFTKEYKIKKEEVFEKIRQIAKEKNIKIIF